MKIKHLFMAIATLLLPACSNSQQHNETEITTERLETTTENNTNNPLNQNLSPYNEIVVTPNPTQNDTTTPVEIENEPLGSYSSKVYTKTSARVKNLKLVCEKINGYIIEPNEEFSYNQVAGPYDRAHGFGKATVLTSTGKETQGYGGGVCQVSSTLYNAVKDTGVEITERHNHSKDVHYVPKNQDATVSYGYLDFKFKNLNEYAIKISATADKNNVTVAIYKV